MRKRLPTFNGMMQRSHVSRTLSGLLSGALLASCSADAPSADKLELATIPRWKEVPKSTPAQFVRGFDTFCIQGPSDPIAKDKTLRASGYVPKLALTSQRPGLYVVDDRRPAVVFNNRICGVRAVSRTGQTEAIGRYIAETFPEARASDPTALGPDVEQAWQIDGGMIATTRNVWIGNKATYTILIFRPEGQA